MSTAAEKMPAADAPLLVDRQNMPHELDQGLGYRAKIGLIVLATDQTIEHEFRLLLNVPGVALWESRILNSPTISTENLGKMEAGMTEATRVIMPGVPLDVVAYGCTSGGMVIGTENVHARIREARPEVACTTPMEATFAAFRALGAKKICFIPPYTADNRARRCNPARKPRSGGRGIRVLHECSRCRAGGVTGSEARQAGHFQQSRHRLALPPARRYRRRHSRLRSVVPHGTRRLISERRISVGRLVSASKAAGGFAVAACGLLLLVFALSLIADARAKGESRTILVFGDSLSAAYGFDLEKSWVRLLEKRLQDHNPSYRVVNASISGETTRGGVARIESVVAEHQPRIVLVELGGNDGLRGINIETTRQNLKRIVETAVDSGARVLLLAMELPPNYGQSYTEEFRKIYQSLGAREDVTLVPFFLDGVAGNAMLMQTDGIHPKAEAQPKLLENIWPYLEPMLEG